MRLRLRLLSRDRDLLLSLDLLRRYLSRERLLLYLSLLRLLLLSLSRDRLLLSRDFRSLSLSRLRSRLLFRSLLFRSSLSRLRRESPLSTSLASLSSGFLYGASSRSSTSNSSAISSGSQIFFSCRSESS